MCLVAVLATLSAAQAAAQAPPGPQDAGDGVEADGGLLIDRIDPERLRQIRTERNRQYILGLGLLAASGAVGFSKQSWVVDEGAIGYAIAALGAAAFIEPMTWRDLEVRVSGNGLALVMVRRRRLGASRRTAGALHRRGASRPLRVRRFIRSRGAAVPTAAPRAGCRHTDYLKRCQPMRPRGRRLEGTDERWTRRCWRCSGRG